MAITKTAVEALAESQNRRREELDAKIRGALITLQENTAIKPTQANLAELAGCHTVTLRDREWPLTELKLLKGKVARERKLEKIEKEEVAKNNRQTISKLNDNLANEVLLWFDKAMEYKRQCDAIEGERNRYRESSILNASKIVEYKSNLETARQYMKSIHGIDLDVIIDSD